MSASGPSGPLVLNPHYWGYVEVLAHIIIKFSREVVNIVN